MSPVVTPRPEATREALPNPLERVQQDLPGGTVVSLKSPVGPLSGSTTQGSGRTARGYLQDERETREDHQSHGHLGRGQETSPEEDVRLEMFQVLPRPDPREVVEGWEHPKDLPRPDPRVVVVVRDHPMLPYVNRVSPKNQQLTLHSIQSDNMTSTRTLLISTELITKGGLQANRSKYSGREINRPPDSPQAIGWRAQS